LQLYNKKAQHLLLPVKNKIKTEREREREREREGERLGTRGSQAAAHASIFLILSQLASYRTSRLTHY